MSADFSRAHGTSLSNAYFAIFKEKGENQKQIFDLLRYRNSSIRAIVYYKANNSIIVCTNQEDILSDVRRHRVGTRHTFTRFL